jgi:hypothetical protein
MELQWENVCKLESRIYVCSYCNAQVTSDMGWYVFGDARRIWLCPRGHPTYFDLQGSQHPSPIFGRSIDNIPSEQVNSLYEEARRCVSVQAYTSAVLACRKLLMNIAVDKGAPSGKSFMDYVEYLAAKNYVPPDGKEWVDHIRKKGNEATHEILLMSKDDAEALIEFTEMLLKFVYEFPARVKSRQSSP